MVVPSAAPEWWGSLIWLIVVAAASFLVAWLSGTHLGLRRPLYIALLFVMTGSLTFGYLAWLGVDYGQVATQHWGWGVLAAVVAAAVLSKPISHQPVTRHVQGRQRRWELVWEGGVYGTTEGLLLSALPAFIAWQLVHALDWGGTSGTLAGWGLALVAAASVVVIHHLGYWSFRNRILVPVALGLTVLTVGFLATGSWIAPVLGHILMHAQLTLHGTEMPPHERPIDAARSRTPSVLMTRAGLRA